MMESVLLDLYSISQTSSGERCAYRAPLIALVFNGHATIQQSCCNHWDCPCCGKTRAKQEYRRITWGSEVLSDEKHKLYFWTLTCRGRELSYDDAMAGYYTWTNILLTSARAKAKRADMYWAYVQVTEHQRKTRAHPHSHIITTFLPCDAGLSPSTDNRNNFVSRWFDTANLSAGLGAQHRISEVANASAVSRYVAKYLFKDMMTDEWPAHWKRVRYSRNWPKPPYARPDMCIVLRTPQEWRQADDAGIEWIASDDLRYEIAIHHMAHVRRNMDDGTTIF